MAAMQQYALHGAAARPAAGHIALSHNIITNITIIITLQSHYKLRASLRYTKVGALFALP